MVSLEFAAFQPAGSSRWSHLVWLLNVCMHDASSWSVPGLRMAWEDLVSGVQVAHAIVPYEIVVSEGGG